jgi:hypothetical protein
MTTILKKYLREYKKKKGEQSPTTHSPGSLCHGMVFHYQDALGWFQLPVPWNVGDSLNTGLYIMKGW